MYRLEPLISATRLLIRSPAEAQRRAREAIRKRYRVLRPMRRDYRQRFNRTLRDWFIYHQREVLFKRCLWMGVRSFKNPLDAWIYQELIYTIRPEVIIEIGSACGGSTLYLAHLLDLIGKGIVISIDLDRDDFQINHERVVVLTGDSSSPEVVEKVAEHCSGKSVFIIHDGGHEKDQVLRDLYAYSRLVSIGSYFVVEDGIIDLFRPGDGIGTYEDGPLAAVEQFLPKNPQFVVDSECERYLVTYNPRGFLRRVA